MRRVRASRAEQCGELAVLDRIVSINGHAVDANANFEALLPPEALSVTLGVMVALDDTEAAVGELSTHHASCKLAMAVPTCEFSVCCCLWALLGDNEELVEDSSFDRVEVYGRKTSPISLPVDTTTGAAEADGKGAADAGCRYVFEARAARRSGESLGLGIGFDEYVRISLNLLDEAGRSRLGD